MKDEVRAGDYSVDLKQHGRGGWITYVENGKSLKFPVELLGTPGLGIFVPTAEGWRAYCKKENAEWAGDGREQIIQRMAQSALNLRYPNGHIEFADQWINLRPGPSFVDRLRDWLS
jgi:hypothetical protein